MSRFAGAGPLSSTNGENPDRRKSAAAPLKYKHNLQSTRLLQSQSDHAPRWCGLTPPTAPVARRRHRRAFSQVRARLIVFGSVPERIFEQVTPNVSVRTSALPAAIAFPAVPVSRRFSLVVVAYSGASWIGTGRFEPIPLTTKRLWGTKARDANETPTGDF